MKDENEFKKWMQLNTDLSEKSMGYKVKNIKCE